ncbi:hypothetical protein PARPLA_00292 [Rhodobacteraceae bacterium THAF1]|uniref:hypothetical protein n=1 Tax=Palleronia sp. THAF1 TaxID=2587842 RepID=UPI000F3E63D8|nr:hypothetical protein [Palleronia sp. THAF1]QFU10143.1 hypothetical protein FIU81_15800 [Palleronia sp. THAF1]VDC16952.1 hypothetical protein PARPLA_00292 [Rhodobacteraceae bacterium THAF1]
MVLRVHYHPTLLARAHAGKHNFTERLRSALGGAIELCGDGAAERRKSAERPGHSLVLMHAPLGPRQFVLRLAYLYPFWRIETTAKRWEFEVARARFDPVVVDGAQAAAFCDRRRKQHLNGAAPGPGDGTVYVPLQGRIRQSRSFQTMSPVEMLRRALEQVGDAPVVAGLHPKEDYDEADHATLRDLQTAHPNLNIVMGDMDRLLPKASLVVTQNSSVALMGYFLHKPAVLFGRIDFHHIAANVVDLGVEQAFEAARSAPPDYDRYLFWFFRQMAISAAAPDAEAQIIAALTRCGWRA